MTLNDDIQFWQTAASEASSDKAACTAFGIAAGLRLARDEYGLSPKSKPSTKADGA